MANKAFKYRIYPNDRQRVLLAKTFGCARFVYNKCLEEQERRYASGEKYASYVDLSIFLVHVLKKENDFLCEVDKFALTNAARHLDAAYKRMFRHQGKHPRFKSKRRSRMSYTTNLTNGNIKVLEFLQVTVMTLWAWTISQTDCLFHQRASVAKCHITTEKVNRVWQKRSVSSSIRSKAPTIGRNSNTK